MEKTVSLVVTRKGVRLEMKRTSSFLFATPATSVLVSLGTCVSVSKKFKPWKLREFDVRQPVKRRREEVVGGVEFTR